MNRLSLLWDGYQKLMILMKNVGLVQVDATTADGLYSSLKDSLKSLGIPVIVGVRATGRRPATNHSDSTSTRCYKVNASGRYLERPAYLKI